jgi:tRNA 2-thiouridine synthesizing protein B
MALVLIKFNNYHPIEKIKIESAKKEDTIVLIQDGIYWGLENLKELTEAEVVAIKEDVLARGYREEDISAKLVDYHGFIDIVEKQERFIG